jgi:DNA-binding NarL/FixJ family response regulator
MIGSGHEACEPPQATFAIGTSRMRVLFVCADKRLVASVTRTLAAVGITMVSATGLTVPSPAEMEQLDALLIWHQQFRLMARVRILDLLRHANRVPVIVALRVQDLPLLADSAVLADGMVFIDANLPRLGKIINLARAGYLIAPADVDRATFRGSMRGGFQPALGPLDIDILTALGEGLTDRQIAQRMGMTEPTAKRLVHKLLRRLSLDNRTRAAVYMKLLVQPRDAMQ